MSGECGKGPYVAGQIRTVCLPPGYIERIPTRYHRCCRIVASYKHSCIKVYTDKDKYHLDRDVFVPPALCQAMKKLHEEAILAGMIDAQRPLDVSDIAARTGSSWFLAKEAAEGLRKQGLIRRSRFSEDRYELPREETGR